MSRVACASGRSMRSVALDPFAWTACAFLEVSDTERLERARAEIVQLDEGALVAFAFNKPSELATRRDAATARHADVQARLLGFEGDPAAERIDQRLRDVESVINAITALEAAGSQWLPMPGAS